MATRVPCLSLFALLLTVLPGVCTDNQYVRFKTNLGFIDVQLFSDESPLNVANFLTYVNSGAYTDSIIHRSATNFVIQGGGYYLANDAFPLNAITANAAVTGEHSKSNVRGTLALALSTGPNSGTDEWFFNEVDNSAALDGTTDGGPFTAFAQIINSNGLSVMDQIGTLTIYDASSVFNSAFTTLPLINYNSTTGLVVQNLVTIFSITPLTVQNFTTWQTAKFGSTPTMNDAPNAIPLNDGVTNLVKYVCDINPVVSMTTADRAKLPKVGSSTINATQYLTLSFQQSSSMVGTTVNVQTSSDLKTWTTVAKPTFLQNGSDTATGDPLLEAIVPVTTATQFIRLNITQP